MVSYETSTIVYIALQIVTILVFAVGAVLAMTGRVRPGQRVLFGVGCGLNILGNAVYLLYYLPNSYTSESVYYLVINIVGTLIAIAGVVLIVIAACRRPGPPTYPYGPAFPGQQPGYPGQQPGYPGQQPGYPGQQPTYPGQQAGYPGQQYGYPPA